MAFTLANVAGRVALVADGRWYDLERLTDGALGPDPMAAIEAHARLHDLADALADATPGGRLDDAVLGPPVPAPRHCFGIGLNYADHAAESGVDLPKTPVVFAKYSGCIAGPTTDIELGGEAVDYEAELVVVIGRRCRDVAAVDAWDVVAGLTAGQDVSDRVLQFAATPPHFGLGKSGDTYGPIGPVIVSPDALADRDDVVVRCEVNGELRQESSTRHLVFDVPHLVEHLSGAMTLHPGDLVFTGTPSGVGMASGRFLAPGDAVVTTVEGVGTMTNRCVARAT